MKKVCPIVVIVCLSIFLAEIAFAIGTSGEKEELDLFRKSTEYRETYRLPQEQEVQLTPSGQFNISFYKIDIKTGKILLITATKIIKNFYFCLARKMFNYMATYKPSPACH